MELIVSLCLSTRTPNHPHRRHHRYGEVNANDSSDLGADQYRENRRQGMDRQVSPHHPRRSEIVLNQSPNTQQYSHPDPVGVIDDTNADNGGECAHPAKCRNELQQSPQHCQGDGVRKSKKEQGRGIEAKESAQRRAWALMYRVSMRWSSLAMPRILKRRSAEKNIWISTSAMWAPSRKKKIARTGIRSSKPSTCAAWER